MIPAKKSLKKQWQGSEQVSPMEKEVLNGLSRENALKLDK